eukprot:scaffold55807_cov43-Phaeocystis_antarctica.AAC.2
MESVRVRAMFGDGAVFRFPKVETMHLRPLALLIPEPSLTHRGFGNTLGEIFKRRHRTLAHTCTTCAGIRRSVSGIRRQVAVPQPASSSSAAARLR